MSTAPQTPAKPTTPAKQTDPFKELGVPILMGLGILIVWFLLGMLPSCLFKESTERGTFGDMFGMVNSLFSGLAFAGVIYTILLQRNELILQREELQLTRIELHDSSTAQTAAARALEKQIQLNALAARLQAAGITLQRLAAELASLRHLYHLEPGASKRSDYESEIFAVQGRLSFHQALLDQISSDIDTLANPQPSTEHSEPSTEHSPTLDPLTP